MENEKTENNDQVVNDILNAKNWGDIINAVGSLNNTCFASYFKEIKQDKSKAVLYNKLLHKLTNFLPKFSKKGNLINWDIFTTTYSFDFTVKQDILIFSGDCNLGNTLMLDENMEHIKVGSIHADKIIEEQENFFCNSAFRFETVYILKSFYYDYGEHSWEVEIDTECKQNHLDYLAKFYFNINNINRKL